MKAAAIPTKSLLEGGPYTPAASTDIRKTFARWLQQQRPQQPLRRAK